MRNVNLDNITEGVIKANAGLKDERTREILESLVRHLHAFAKETKLTSEEWLYGMDFLYRAGQISDENRNEFMILSDSLGLSSVVDLNRDAESPDDFTQASPLGPFYVDGIPFEKDGVDLGTERDGDKILLKGFIETKDGEPIAGAEIDLWQTGADGLYDVQVADRDGYFFRCRLHSQDDGSFTVKTILPKGYSAPTDGPVGVFLMAAGRNIFRPGHYHLQIKASGYRTLITELFYEGDEHLADDVAFGVRESLVVEPVLESSRDAAEAAGMPSPFSRITYHFKLVEA